VRLLISCRQDPQSYPCAQGAACHARTEDFQNCRPPAKRQGERQAAAARKCVNYINFTMLFSRSLALLGFLRWLPPAS
jgi:hypothetical protein